MVTLVACAVAISSGYVLVRASGPASTAGRQPSDSMQAAVPQPDATVRWLRADALFTPLAPSAEKPMLTQMPVRNFGERPEGVRAPLAIVLHATGSGRPGSEYRSLARLKKRFNGKAEVSAHYGIDRRGRIAQYVPDNARAWHTAAEGWNDVSIGIELLNDNSGTQPYPAAQMRSAERLVKSLAEKYGIPMEFIVRHGDVQPWDRRDPVAFAWRDFRRALRTS